MNRSGIGANESVAHPLSGPPPQIRLRNYALAILSVGVALGASLLLEHFHFRAPSALLMLFAVAISSWYGGRGPAVLAVILSTISFYWYFVEPVRTIYIYRSDIPFFIIFTGLVVLLSWFGTVRHRAEAALRRSEQTLRDAIDTIPASAWSTLPDGSVDFMNQRAADFTGLPRESALGWGWGSAMHPDDLPKFLEKWRTALASGKPMEGEARMRRGDGAYHWWLIRNAPLRDELGKIVKWYGTGVDIQDRKQAEEALRRSEAFLSEAQRLSHTGSFSWRRPSGELSWSDETFRIFEYDPVIKPTVDLVFQRIHPEDRARVWQIRDRASQDGTDFESEHRLLMPDNRVKWIHALAHVAENSSGDIDFVGAVTDVTERKRAEEALRQTEQVLRDAIDTIPVNAWSALPDGSIDFMNQRTLEATGLSREKVLSWQWRSALHPHDVVGFVEKWRTALKVGEPMEGEARLRQADGTYHWWLIRDVPLRDELGNVVKWYGTGVDIQDRKQAEEALRRSEAYLAEAQRLSKIGSFVWSLQAGRIVHWSEELFRITGFDPKEGLPDPESLWQRIHPEDRVEAAEHRQKAVHDKTEYTHDYRIVLPDGTIKHLHVIGHPMPNDAGEAVEFIGTTIDVTENKRREEALRESETRFRTFLDHAGDAFFMLDFEQGIIIDVNRQACESLGYTRQELIGRTPLTFHPSSYQAEMESVAERAAAGETVFDTHSHRRKDGRLFPVEVHTSLVWYGGRRFLLKVAHDISDRVRAEEQREKLRQLEADLAHINRVSMLGELTASIAHEVNQPLSGVVSNGSACLRWLAGETPNMEEAREAARRIVRDGKRAAEVVARVRAMTKRTGASREKLDVNETIREVLALVGDEAKKSRVAIRTKFADDVFPVLGDRVHLQQVVLNLVMNGIEAMSSGGEQARELTITTRNVNSDQVQVTIQDSGIGLDPNVMPKIFDPFYTTKSSGMGMGLSISRSILQVHGGQLWAAANDGPGVSFHFTLPGYDESSHAAA